MLRGEQLQGTTIIRNGTAGTLGIVAVGFIHHYVICHLNHSPLDALQLIARTRNQHQQEEIYHIGHYRLRLPHTHRLNEHSVKSSCFQNQQHFSCGTGGTAEFAVCGRRAHESMLALGKATHSGFVAHDRTAADRT